MRMWTLSDEDGDGGGMDSPIGSLPTGTVNARDRSYAARAQSRLLFV